VRVQVIDPSAYAPAYDHALCAALARAGADVELITSRFGYGPVIAGTGFTVREDFYRVAPGAPGSPVRTAAKLLQHGPDMLRLRRRAREADVAHFQWLPVEPADLVLRPRGVPTVLTAHRILPLSGRRAQAWGRRRLYEAVDAVVVHTEDGRGRLVGELGLDPRRVEVIPHGVFDRLAHQDDERPLPPALAAVEGPVVLYLGIWRPEHGLDVLLDAWRGITGAELWIAGLPKMAAEPLMASAPPGVRFEPRFVTDPELPAFFRRADVVVFPYRTSVEASGALFTALAFAPPILATALGAFADLAAHGGARVVAPGDAGALHDALAGLLADAPGRARLAAGARAAAAGPFSWDGIATRTLALYGRLLGTGADRNSGGAEGPVRPAL
jgi:glycosyltransferase involved in cell wall biosynthesis